jgi:hypothetical protein
MQNVFIRPTASREQRLLLAAVWWGCVIFLCGLTIADPDLWGHTLYGLRALHQGVLTERTDPFSYTAPGAVWVNHEWLTELQFGWLWQHFGNAGLVLWRNALVLALFVVALAALKRARAGLAASILLLVFCTECLADFVVFVRPQMATFALFAVFLFILRRWWDDPRQRAVWWLPPLMIVWVNMHGGFLAGCGIVGLFCVASAIRSVRRHDRQTLMLSGLLLALVAGATFVNPYGAGLHAMLLEHLGTTQFVREWQPLWGAQQSPVYYVPFLLAPLAVVGRRRLQAIDVIVLLVVGWQAVSHVRHVALLGIAALILLPGAATEALDRLFPRLIVAWSTPAKRGLRRACVAFVLAVLAGLQVRGSLPFWQEGLSPWDIAVEGHSFVPGMPLRAVAAIRRSGLKGNLVTDYGWGQFAIWHLYPESHVAFDGRYRTVFQADLERQFLAWQTATLASSPTTPIIDDYPTQLALLPVDSLPDHYLSDRPDWDCVYRDDQAAVYIARDSSGDLAAGPSGRALVAPELPARWSSFPGDIPTGTEIASGIRNDRSPNRQTIAFGSHTSP